MFITDFQNMILERGKCRILILGKMKYFWIEFIFSCIKIQMIEEIMSSKKGLELVPRPTLNLEAHQNARSKNVCTWRKIDLLNSNGFQIMLVNGFYDVWKTIMWCRSSPKSGRIDYVLWINFEKSTKQFTKFKWKT